MPWFLMVSRPSRDGTPWFLRPFTRTFTRAQDVLKYYRVPLRRTFEFYLVVVGAVRREQRARVLEVLALRLALQRLLARLVVPGAQEDAPVGGGEGVLLPLEGAGGGRVVTVSKPLLPQGAATS